MTRWWTYVIFRGLLAFEFGATKWCESLSHLTQHTSTMTGGVFLMAFVTFYCVWPLTGPEQKTYFVLVNRNTYIAAWGYRIIRCNSGSSWGDVGIMLPPHLPNPCLNILIKHLPCEAGDGCPQIIEAWLSKSLRLNQKPKYIIIKCTYMCIYLYIFIFFCTMCFSLHPDSGAFHPVFCWIDGK